MTWARILVQVMIYRMLLIGWDGSTNWKPTIYYNLYDNARPALRILKSL